MFLDPLSTPFRHMMPYNMLLADLRRVVRDDGVHLSEGRMLLCEQPLGDDRPDQAWHGLAACELATCPRCKEVALRIVEGAQAEAAYRKQTAGPLVSLAVAQAEGDVEGVAASAAALEAFSFWGMWLAFLAALCLAPFDAGWAVLLAALGALGRLWWLALKRPLTRLD